MSCLIVLLAPELPRAGLELEHVLATTHQDILLQGRATLASLPWQDANELELVLVAPAAMLSWHPVRLPANSRRRPWERSSLRPAVLRAALEGLLEDELLDPLPRLHLALAPAPSAEGQTWVAACAHDWLQAWIAEFTARGHVPATIVPEFEPAAPGESEAIHVIDHEGRTHLVRVSVQGVTTAPAGAAIVRWLQWPQDATVQAQSSVATQAELLFGRPVALLSPAQRLLDAARSPWDLAQFDLRAAGASAWRDTLARHVHGVLYDTLWRPARWLAVVAFGVFLAGLHATAWQLHALQAASQARIENLFQETFGPAPRVGPVLWQMEVEVGRLRQQTGASGAQDLESVLMELAGPGDKAPAPGAIDVQDGQLRLADWRPDADELAGLRQKLAARGLMLREDAGSWIIAREDAP